MFPLIPLFVLACGAPSHLYFPDYWPRERNPRVLVRPGRKILSTSGDYLLSLVATKNVTETATWTYLYPVIEDVHGNIVYESDEHFAGWFSTSATWDAQDRVWLYSSDVGWRVWTATDGRFDVEKGFDPNSRSDRQEQKPWWLK